MNGIRQGTADTTTSRQLALLFEISKGLMQFRTVEEVVPAVLDEVSQAVPLRTAVLIGEVENHAILRAWRAPDVSDPRLEEAVEHAKAAYQASFDDQAIIAGRLRDAKPKVSARLLSRWGTHRRQKQDQFILLPLVLGQRGVFGAVQFERVEPMDEPQLAFLCTVVNLLAIALDRHVGLLREVAERARAQALERTASDLLAREEAALARAQKAIDSRDLFLSVVSHDLRDLAGAADLATHLLLKSVPEGDERRPRVQTIERTTKLMRALLQDLLDTASIDAGQLVLDPEMTDLPPLVEATVGAYRSLAEVKSVELALDVETGLPAVWADGRRLGQALGNLVKNAIRFSPEGGVVAIKVAMTGETVKFSVTDQGPGIPREHHESIFQRFWSEGRRRLAGVGLGLFIVKEVAHKHGGTVGVDSAPGQGSTLWFTVPLVQARPGDPPSGK